MIFPAKWENPSSPARASDADLAHFDVLAVLLGTISSSEGSSIVRIGETTVVCGIKFEVRAPLLSASKDGFLGTNFLDWSAVTRSVVVNGDVRESIGSGNFWIFPPDVSSRISCVWMGGKRKRVRGEHCGLRDIVFLWCGNVAMRQANSVIWCLGWSVEYCQIGINWTVVFKH